MALKNPLHYIQWKRLPYNTLPLPAYQSAGAAGFDLQACFIQSEEDLALYDENHPQAFNLVLDAPNPAFTGRTTALIHTRFEIAIPAGHVLLICPRSGLSTKYETIIPNSPGIIDEDYRGELIIALKNIGNAPLVIHHGMRIAQAVLVPVAHAEHYEVDTLPETVRGKGGFGSTGA